MSMPHSAAALRRHTPMAKRIAQGFLKNLPPNVLRDDLEQAALIGLWDGLSKHPDNGEPGHEWYLCRRIRGAVLDELRTQDWLPRRARKQNAGRGAAAVAILRMDELSPTEAMLPAPDESPDERLDTERQYTDAWRAPLSDRLRRVLHLTEVRGIKFKDVADDLGVSEPRISQLHARGLLVMRAHLLRETDPVTTTPILPATTAAITQGNHDHQDADGTDRAIRSREGRPRSTRIDPAPVRTSGLGAQAPRQLARPLPGRSREGELHRAAVAVLERDVLPAAGQPAAVPASAPTPCRALIDVASTDTARGAPALGSHDYYGHKRAGRVSAALWAALPETGLDLRAELRCYQGSLVAQALSRSGGDLTAAARLLGLSPLELARAQAPADIAPVDTAPVASTRPEDPVMKQSPTEHVKAVPTPRLVGALAALPERELPEPLPAKPEFGRIDQGLLRIDRAVIERLTIEGYSSKQIARRLGVNHFFVERIQRMLEKPLAKCGEKKP